MTGVSSTVVMFGLGLSVPSASAAQYWGIRIAPCESCPRRLARTSIWAIRAASAGGTCRAAKMWRVFRSSGTTSMVGMAPLLGKRQVEVAMQKSGHFFMPADLDADVAIDVVGTMMWAYGVPFHITHGPPFVQSVGYASSWVGSVGSSMMCGPLTTH